MLEVICLLWNGNESQTIRPKTGNVNNCLVYDEWRGEDVPPCNNNPAYFRLKNQPFCFAFSAFCRAKKDLTAALDTWDELPFLPFLFLICKTRRRRIIIPPFYNYKF